jgi:Tfp pilus assembly protein PilN
MEGFGPGGESATLYEKAERIKERLGVSPDGLQERILDKSINVPKIIFHMRPILERMAAEIGRSLDYYKNQFNVDRIDRVLLTGGGAHLKNFSSYLGNELRLPVTHFNPLRELPFDLKKIDVGLLDQLGSRFTTAAGISLPQPKRIELLPAKEPFLNKAHILKSIPILTPLITLIAFLLIIWNISGKVATLKQERGLKVGKVGNMESLQTKLTRLKEEEKKLKEERSLFPSSMTVPVPYVKIMYEISHIAPENVTLTLISAKAKKNLLEKEGQTSISQEEESQWDQGVELQITGIAFGSDIRCLTALAQIIEGLEKSPSFENVKLMSAEENKLYNRQAAEFEIVCDIVPNHSSATKMNLEELEREGP